MCCTFEIESNHASARPAADSRPPSNDRETRPAAARDRRARRPLRSVVAVGAAAIVAVALAAAAMVAGAAEPRHDITLVARNMAFYLPQGTEANPALEVGREEQVRLTLVNRDRGIDHDLAVESLDIETEAIPGDGASITVEFRAPREPGVHEYVCRLHGKMMRGEFLVR